MGQRLVVDYATAGTYRYDVVGVVVDVRFSGPRTEPRYDRPLSGAAAEEPGEERSRKRTRVRGRTAWEVARPLRGRRSSPYRRETSSTRKLVAREPSVVTRNCTRTACPFHAARLKLRCV